MRMKKLLTFLVLLTVSVGTWAAGSVTTNDGVCTIQLADGSDLNSLTFDASALAATKVVIKCTNNFSNAEISKINEFTNATTLEMSGCEGADGLDLDALSMSNLQYLRLPSNFNTVSSMSGLNTTNNPNLEVAVSTDAVGTSASKIVIQSFKANGFYNSRDNLSLNTELSKVKFVTMSGMYGANDLHTSADGNIFGNAPAVWDFTGADFEAITITTPGTYSTTAPYYANNDPFTEGPRNYPAADFPYTTNAFYYFSNYAQNAVKINLPTEITDLPDVCLMGFGSNGQSTGNYVLAYPDADVSETNYVIEELVIPNNITRIGYDCASGCHIRKVTIGNGIKEICGGAFGNSNDIEEVDFVPGVSDCVLGNGVFNEGQTSQMKHIVLPEGIVSLGKDCFRNSQHLESIRLPETLKYIGDGCFYDCHALSSITIPENVEKIGKAVFSLTALKDVYLTTKDPAKIPVIFSAGTNWADNDCTFSINEEYGNNSIPYNDVGYGDMTWDEAVDYLFTHSNRIAVLHFPDELAEKVRASISNQYDYTTGDRYKIPSMRNVATWGQNLRGNIPGADLGNATTGTYSQDGWAQFLLMKAYDPDTETEVFEKEYDDVWYTMCFPFDLTDEQLAGAFTENFNIVDFSAVEIRDREDGMKELVLHFNNVAETVYKDADGNVYVRKRDGAGGLTGSVVRVKDGNYDYNIYYKVNDGTVDTSVEYKHVSVGQSGNTYKTKTFAADGNASGDILYIEGYLAQAGHPYMIHPNTGATAGSPKVRCHFSGITWIPEEDRDALYESEARTVDLGGAAYKGATPNSITYVTGDNKFTENNFSQAAYEGYAGQTYTFKGNWRAVREGSEVPPEPTAVADPGPEPTFSIPTQPIQTLTEPDAPPTNPEANTEGWESAYNNFLQYLVSYPGDGYTSYANDGRWVSNGLASSTPITEELFNNYNSRVIAYANYLTALASFDQAAYDRDYAAYLENQAAWDAWETYSADPDAYETTWENSVHSPWQTKKAAYDQYLEDYADWQAELENYQVLIPQYAYFLARANGAKYPKYYRETAAEAGRTSGFWTQYSAIIEPNNAAKAGIEGISSASSAGTKSYNIAFNEDYEGEFDATAIKDIIAKAEEKGEKVEYMNIVYSINGEIISKDSRSLGNLPQGMYIVNGKKYLVK